MADDLSVTVGIPTRNNEDSIGETLALLLEQTRPPDRILVVDASTDRTPELIDRMASDSAVPIDRYDQPERGRGVGAARSRIYEEFEGDLLACLDTNRRVERDWLERRVAFHRDHPEYDILSSTAHPDWDGPVTDPKQPFFLKQANCTLRSEALDRVRGWDPWFPRGEDWDMRIRLWRSGATAYARSDLHGEAIVEDDTSAVRKRTGRPSSVAFLRKYGAWYLRFHPVHPAGDLLSVVALVALACVPFLALVSALASGLALALVVALTAAYVHVKESDVRGVLDPREITATAVLSFFVLGVTAVREFAAGDHPWNYGGVEGEESGE